MKNKKFNKNKFNKNKSPILYQIFLILSKIIKIFLNLLVYLLKEILDLINIAFLKIKRKFYFSISFKITVIYAFIFSITMFISSSIFLIILKVNLLDQISFFGSNEKINYYIVLILALNTIGLFIVLSISSKISKNLLKQVDDMTEIANQISAKDLNKRINVAGSKDELKDLAKTFNDMLDRIQSAYEQQNRFVSDASHELRTPIAVIKGYDNLLDRWGKNDKKILDESIVAIKSEADNMQDLVEKLLFLARADKNTQQINKSIFSVSELINELIKESKMIDSSHNITSRYNDDYQLYADRDLIKQSLRIFIDNSIKFTKSDGNIFIDSKPKGNCSIISVEDSGVGISKEDIKHIFERFYTTDKSRNKDHSGNGLGLSIVKWIIKKHNGKIHVESTLNKGTKITIILPNSEPKA